MQLWRLCDCQLNTSVSSPNALLILRSKVIVCPPTGQMISVGGAASSTVMTLLCENTCSAPRRREIATAMPAASGIEGATVKQVSLDQETFGIAQIA